MSKLRYIVDGLKLSMAYIVANILKLFPDNKDIWLVGERINEAKDNGYHLFKYIRENNNKDKVYYIIGKGSKDTEKLRGLGNIIYGDSFKHYVYYCLASKLVIAHLGSCVPDSPVCWKAEEIKLIKNKRAFIQHGVIKELIPSLMYENTNVDLFICGAKPEYNFVKKYYSYPDGVVKYTGLARFDNLHDFQVKNQILVMPTWRQWIPSLTWSDDIEKCKSEFLESEYYKRFNELINDMKIKNILEKDNMNMIFYPHHEMQGYIGLFKSDNSRIIIANEDDYDVQQLLKESKILITDYSSIAFDFAYMRKTILYYQFDELKYYEKHYSKGYFDYKTNGFGPVVNDISQIRDVLSSNICNNYKDRIDLFFELYDDKNSKRIYDSIKNI